MDTNKGETETFKRDEQDLETRCKELERQLKGKEAQIRSLERKNRDLETEASAYQSALGIATSFNLSDSDQNHAVQLSKDIMALSDTLETYVTSLRPNIEVDMKRAKDLLHHYNCQPRENPDKTVIKAALQRHVLESIIKQAEGYFANLNRSKKGQNLESEINTKVMELTKLLDKFHSDRFGDDEITRCTPIKLRQQVYSALGTRGFNNLKELGENHEPYLSYFCSFLGLRGFLDAKKSNVHDFIIAASEDINKTMNKFRAIKDARKNEYVNGLAEDLVRNVVRIFFFRLKIQEPVAKYRWCESNEKINKSYMTGSWEDDDDDDEEEDDDDDDDDADNDDDDLVVEICSFPLIYKPFDPNDPNGLKAYTPAKVYPRRNV